MSNACDPRNRPGFDAGDPSAFLPPQASAATTPGDDLRTVLMAGFLTAMIVTSVFALLQFA